MKNLYYEVASYFVGERMYHKIEGECKRCGFCCRNIYSADCDSEREFRFMQFIYPVYRRFYVSRKDENGALVFACKFVSDEGLCTVYEKRPSLCRRYPASRLRFKAELYPGCGFRQKDIKFEDYIK